MKKKQTKRKEKLTQSKVQKGRRGIYIPPELYERVKKVAEKTVRSASSVVVLCVLNYIDVLEKKESLNGKKKTK
ncbi:MAG: hypothetical protein GF317_19250 [Candidatus Lokiarchaeota archaeon]|nr:hypothetical protein [Candidatus Lokiarchaeota archaeon]